MKNFGPSTSRFLAVWRGHDKIGIAVFRLVPEVTPMVLDDIAAQVETQAQAVFLFSVILDSDYQDHLF